MSAGLTARRRLRAALVDYSLYFLMCLSTFAAIAVFVQAFRSEHHDYNRPAVVREDDGR